MANPPKPAERHRRNGNPGRVKLPDPAKVIALPAADGIPDPLRPLGIEGRRSWDRIWSGGAAWLSPGSDIELAQALCETIDERESLRSVVMSGEGDWRDRVALRNLDTQIKNHLSALGFTPIDRTRMGVAEVRQVSKLDALRARKAT
jgi:hypothetical protein